jgi:hypothetical protein
MIRRQPQECIGRINAEKKLKKFGCIECSDGVLEKAPGDMVLLMVASVQASLDYTESMSSD